MAELPDMWPGTWPEPAPPVPGALTPVRPIGGTAPRFGVAHDLDVIQRGTTAPGRGPGPERPFERGPGPERPFERGPGPERPFERGVGPERPFERGVGPGAAWRSRAPSASHDGAWNHIRTWWACRERHPGDLWHRFRCRFGRHDFQGGRQIQVGGRLVSTERCCAWCSAKPL